jgi:hypothetical protein
VRLLAFVAVAPAVVLLAGCGGTSRAHQLSEAHRGFHDRCLYEAKRVGWAPTDAEPICVCMDKTIFAQITEDEFYELNKHDAPPEVVARMNTAFRTSGRSCAIAQARR